MVSKARGPPVDAPIATAFIPGCLASEGLTIMAGRSTMKGAVCTRKLVATAAFSNSSLRSSALPSVESLSGLAIKSTAPMESASMVTWLPLLVRLESIITGTLWRRTISFNVCNPSRRGISTSRVIKSGFNLIIFSSASIPSRAVPTTANRGSAEKISLTIFLISAESSTTNTFICSMTFSYLRFPSLLNQR